MDQTDNRNLVQLLSKRLNHGKKDRERSFAKILDMLDEKQLLAVRILAGEMNPTKEWPRSWAIKQVKKLIAERYYVLTAIDALKFDDIECHMKRFEYFIPKAKQIIETSGPGGGPLQVQQIVEDLPYDQMLAISTMVRDQMAAAPTVESPVTESSK